MYLVLLIRNCINRKRLVYLKKKKSLSFFPNVYSLTLSLLHLNYAHGIKSVLDSC